MNRTGFSASTKSSNASGNNKSWERSKPEMCVMADSINPSVSKFVITRRI